MQYSANRGIDTACRLSVRPSVCLSVTLLDQDHISWKSWTLFPGEHGEIWGRLEVGREKVACWSTKAAISLKRVQVEEKLTWMAHLLTNALSNVTIPDPLRPPVP